METLRTVARSIAGQAPLGLAGAVRRTIWSLDPDLPISGVRTVDEVVALVLSGEGEAGIAKRLDNGTLHRAVSGLPTGAIEIARETQSLETALQWSAVAGDSLGKVVEFDIYRKAKPDAFTKVSLQRLLGLPTPRYAHLPVAVNVMGEKLSKQTLAAPITPENPVAILNAALVFLGQDAIADCAPQDTKSFWKRAIAGWRMNRVPRQRTLHAPALPDLK